ncbi:hypothetical protein [Bordetella genomosp. 4]|uniref:Uncharacterized protein n=1 Tax=Bordetella genomosp. 4 TaxID=463044 RepID=A0A261URQ6_9BORD|nr:hypothetical protein [Bordetella genomosp. 4]OZI42355.1 hypothetical protein CAL21_22125 [Bordetella genomosp. 4]OZI64588.1 hypothetical protein CAL20_02725 [Bordetella genomosp. 4]
MVLHLSVPKYHCTDCHRYFRHRFSGIRPRLRATEAYRLEVFEAHEGGVSQRKLTVTHRIGSATVERWYQSFVRQRVSELSRRAFGFRNFENYRMRVLAQCGWNGVINRV